ncbi:MAG: hypothetical protein KDA87_20165 [Planctomycetales bacterium]|nr:hypothetical protein [Planctomycetales bacterium]
MAIQFAGVVLLMGLVTACKQSPEAEEHAHDHHDEHASVLASFESSVEDVLEHGATIQEAFESDSPDAAHDALHIIGHLIETLPELAVDTDLSESDWSEVKSASDQLMEAYGHVDAQFHGVTDGPSFADVKPTILQATEVLRKLADKSAAAKPQQP